MLNERENQPGFQEPAYTAPVESDASTAFQFHSDLTPPSVKRQRREKSRRKWLVAIVCSLIVLLCLALAISIFLLRYQIIFRNDEGGFGLQIARRTSAVITPDALGIDGSSINRQVQNAPSGVSGHEWNGTTLHLEAPERAADLSWSGVYQEWSESVAAVTATDADGNETVGSAVVMTEDGFLMTSSHVVLYADSIRVSLQGLSYEAELVGLDISSDLAVIRIQADNLKAAGFGLSETVSPGDEVAVLGTSLTGVPGIYTGTVTAATIGYSYRGFAVDLFEISLPLGAQCSGAPVLNRYGQVIGIVNTEISDSFSNADSLSFAIPMHFAKDIIDQLLEYGFVPGRPSSGLTVAEIPAAYAMYYRYPSCIYVTAVNEDSTAYEAGVRQGDLIISANGTKIQSIDQLYSVINGMQAGDELTLELFRDGDYGTISFPLMDAARLAG